MIRTIWLASLKRVARQMPREGAAAKARRLLVEGRVVVCEARGRHIRGMVRGDGGTYWPVEHVHGAWLCPCPSLTECSHVKAMRLVTSPVRLIDDQPRRTGGRDADRRADR